MSLPVTQIERQVTNEKKLEIRLPRPLFLGSHYKFWRSEIEYEKNRLMAESLNSEAPKYEKPEIDMLVPLAVVAKEFSLSTRTLMRRISEMADTQGDAA